MGYCLRGHKGERNNCFGKIQLVGQKYRDKTTLASKTQFSRHCFGFQSRRFSLLVGYNIQPSSSSTNENAALIIDNQLDFTTCNYHAVSISYIKQVQLKSIVAYSHIIPSVCIDCIADSFFVCVSKSKVYSRTKAEPKSNEKTITEGGRERDLRPLSLLPHTPPYRFRFLV